METIKTSSPGIHSQKEDEKLLKSTMASEEHALTGTMISVGLVLASIIISWVAVFWLYLSRV